MNAFEAGLLKKLAGQPQGRGAFDWDAYKNVLPMAQRLIDEGYIKERRLDNRPGFQLLDRGREYLGGQS